MTKLPTYFVSHGGGPWPYMPDRREAFAKLEQSLVEMRRELGGAPKAMLVVSGHWETRNFAVSSAAHPGMVYDYYGFPDYTYQIRYPAPGSPALAARVQELLNADGVACGADPDQGFDHGTFSLMQPVFPDADMPIVQLSILESYDPRAHLAAGRALAPLREEGVVIVGSGSSYHNMRIRSGASAVEGSQIFDAWLQKTLTSASPAERLTALENWSEAPGGRFAHPREDHLVPLMVAAGAAGPDLGSCVYHEEGFALGGTTLSSFRFGSAPEPGVARAA